MMEQMKGCEQEVLDFWNLITPPLKATLCPILAPCRSMTVVSSTGISCLHFAGHRHPWFYKKACPSLCLILLEKSEQSLLFSVPRPWMCQASGSLPTSLSIAGSASNLTLFSQSAKTFRLFTLETNFLQLTQSYWLNNDFLPHLKVISVGIMTWRRKVNAFSVLLYEGQAVRVESHSLGSTFSFFPPVLKCLCETSARILWGGCLNVSRYWSETLTSLHLFGNGCQGWGRVEAPLFQKWIWGRSGVGEMDEEGPKVQNK